MSYQNILPYSFAGKGFVSPDGERLIRKTILKVIGNIEDVRIQFQFRFGGEAPEAHAEMMEAYLIDKGVNPYSLVFQHQPDESYVDGTFEIFWRVLNVDQ